MNVTVAVTGATGFVGRHVVADLLDRGIPVRAIGRSTTNLPTHTLLTTVPTRDLFTENVSDLTGLVTESIDYNVGLEERDFSRRELERGIVK